MSRFTLPDALEARLPDDEADRAAVLGVVLAAFALLFVVTPLRATVPGSLAVFVEIGILFAVYGMLVLGLDLQYGHTGLVNFGHVVFFAVGAYTVGIVASQGSFSGTSLGLPWPLALVAGVIAAGAVGALVGSTSIRLRDDFLAIATLAAAEIFHSITVNVSSVFGGSTGILSIPQPLGQAIGEYGTTMVATLLLFGGLTALSFAAVSRLTEAPYGRVLRAIRADELVTRSVGKPVFTYKMQSFVYGAALAGFAGGVFALYNGAISPEFFTIQVTVTVWIGMLLGGAANHRAVLGGLAVIMGIRLFSRFANQAAPVSSADFAALRLIAVGLILILVVRYRPAGIWGNPKELGVDS